MNLFDLMSQEHLRIERALARSSASTGFDGVHALAQYLQAQHGAMYASLATLAPDGAREALRRHESLRVHALSTRAQCRRGDTQALGAARALHRAWKAHGDFERTQLRALFNRVFTDEELGQLAAALKFEIEAAHDAARPARGLFGKAWQWLRRRPAPAAQVQVI